MTTETIIVGECAVELCHNPRDGAKAIEQSHLDELGRAYPLSYVQSGTGPAYHLLQVPGLARSVIRSVRQATKEDWLKWRESRGAVRLNMAEAEAKKDARIRELEDLKGWFRLHAAEACKIPHPDVSRWQKDQASILDYLSEQDDLPMAAKLVYYRGVRHQVIMWFLRHDIPFTK